MARKWHVDGDDEDRLPEGVRRTGYDADTQTYTYEAADGSEYIGRPGQRYGELTRTGELRRPHTDATARPQVTEHGHQYCSASYDWDADDEYDEYDDEYDDELTYPAIPSSSSSSPSYAPYQVYNHRHNNNNNNNINATASSYRPNPMFNNTTANNNNNNNNNKSNRHNTNPQTPNRSNTFSHPAVRPPRPYQAEPTLAGPSGREALRGKGEIPKRSLGVRLLCRLSRTYRERRERSG